MGRGDVDHGLVLTREDRNRRPLDAESKRFQDLTAEAKSLWASKARSRPLTCCFGAAGRPA